jgi:hypothetical protein
MKGGSVLRFDDASHHPAYRSAPRTGALLQWSRGSVGGVLYDREPLLCRALPKSLETMLQGTVPRKADRGAFGLGHIVGVRFSDPDSRPAANYSNDLLAAESHSGVRFTSFVLRAAPDPTVTRKPTSPAAGLTYTSVLHRMQS